MQKDNNMKGLITVCFLFVITAIPLSSYPQDVINKTPVSQDIKKKDLIDSLKVFKKREDSLKELTDNKLAEVENMYNYNKYLKKENAKLKKEFASSKEPVKLTTKKVIYSLQPATIKRDSLSLKPTDSICIKYHKFLFFKTLKCDLYRKEFIIDENK